jgi:hypothetical protein
MIGMKKYGIVLSPVFITLVSFFYYDNTDFSGEWHVETTDANFSLRLTQKATNVSGRHCSVLYEGKKIDCSTDASDSVTITGIASKADAVNVTFRSTFSGKSGRATIKKISATQIKWAITKEPDGEYFIPANVILTKQ